MDEEGSFSLPGLLLLSPTTRSAWASLVPDPSSLFPPPPPGFLAAAIWSAARDDPGRAQRPRRGRRPPLAGARAPSPASSSDE